MTKHGAGAKARSFALVVIAGISLAGCSAGSSGDPGTSADGDGEGLPAGATMEEYQAAFEDIEPITIYTQSSAPQGSATGVNLESYAASVEEWSGGKITFDIAFSNAVAAPAEIDDALRDGRLDLGQNLPIYEPADYPVTTQLIEAGVLNDGSALVGVLQSNAWPSEVAFNTPEFLEEWDEQGLVPLIPNFNSGANALFCADERTSIAELNGETVSAGGTIQIAQVEALGATSTSIAYTELFESLQRGVVSCTVSSETVALLGGYLPEAPHVMIDPEATFAAAPGGLAFSKMKWEELPLVAKQLFWDRLGVFIEQNMTMKIWPNTQESAEVVAASGGAFHDLDDDARDAILAINADVLDDLRASTVLDGEAMVAASEEAATRWTQRVIDMGYDPDVSYSNFDEWWTGTENVDISDYVDIVMEEVYGPHRPS